ncbi:MAG: alcohol dehydrogenase catalytic domain-containing protein [Chloroflexi bacterium]|nr:alcohol dehydrogenase catalytic domain-containing protein [Chloroflexota bacterium]
MKALVLDAKWEPRPDYTVTPWEKETGKAITGSSVWRHPQLNVQTVADPTPGPDDVLLQVKACGVCGSDIHFYEKDKDDYILYPGLTKFPTTTGHEFSGEVVAVGKQVKTLKVGDMVTAEEMIWCGYCTPCRNGFPNHCENLEEIGFTIPGAFAEYLAIGAKYCWKLDAIAERYGSKEKAYEAGSVVEPTSVAYNGIFPRAGGFAPGAFTAIFGAGPIGLASIALCRASGAGLVVAFEVSENRRAIAKKLGADYAYDPRTVVPHQVLMELTKGEGVDFCVEAAGAPTKTIPEMEKALAINGKIVQIGRAAERVPMYLETLQVRRGQVYGAQGHSGDAIFPSVIRMMASGRLDMTQMITARYDLPKTVEAIAASGERFHGKITVKP